MPRWRWILFASLIVLAAATQPAWAARAIDIQFEGPGMGRAVLVRWAQISQAQDAERAVTGSIRIFEPAHAPTGALGIPYDMKVFNFIPLTPPEYMSIDRWTFYPERGLIRTNDDSEPWLEPSAPVLSLFARAIRGELPAGRAAWPPPPEPDDRWLAVALAVGLMSVLLFLIRSAAKSGAAAGAHSWEEV